MNFVTVTARRSIDTSVLLTLGGQNTVPLTLNLTSTRIYKGIPILTTHSVVMSRDDERLPFTVFVHVSILFFYKEQQYGIWYNPNDCLQTGVAFQFPAQP